MTELLMALLDQGPYQDEEGRSFLVSVILLKPQLSFVFEQSSSPNV